MSAPISTEVVRAPTHRERLVALAQWFDIERHEVISQLRLDDPCVVKDDGDQAAELLKVIVESYALGYDIYEGRAALPTPEPCAEDDVREIRVLSLPDRAETICGTSQAGSWPRAIFLIGADGRTVRLTRDLLDLVDAVWRHEYRRACDRHYQRRRQRIRDLRGESEEDEAVVEGASNSP